MSGERTSLPSERSLVAENFPGSDPCHGLIGSKPFASNLNLTLDNNKILSHCVTWTEDHLSCLNDRTIKAGRYRALRW